MLTGLTINRRNGSRPTELYHPTKNGQLLLLHQAEFAVPLPHIPVIRIKETPPGVLLAAMAVHAKTQKPLVLKLEGARIQLLTLNFLKIPPLQTSRPPLLLPLPTYHPSASQNCQISRS
jgi:hypothetical protein